jgi:TetR/AcrR family transcriptional repressor of mexJK operon
MARENRRAWNPGDKRYGRMAEKKQQIMQAAQSVFIRNGYERTSMDTIAREAGVAKMTVYRQFADKETLFIACMNDQCREMLMPEKYAIATNREEAEKILIEYGQLIVELITRNDILMLYRMLIGEINHFQGLGQVFYRGGPSQAISVIERILGSLFDHTTLRLRAQAFFWASLGDTYERVVLGVTTPAEAKETFNAQIKIAAALVLR